MWEEIVVGIIRLNMQGRKKKKHLEKLGNKWSSYKLLKSVCLGRGTSSRAEVRQEMIS